MSAARVTDPAVFGRVAVVMGGWSAERPVSLDSGAAVAAGLERRGVDVTRVDPDRARILGLGREGFDRAWLALHGPGGEDGVVQAALELQGLPYTGSGVLACALAMDKLRCKALWAAHGIPTPVHRVLGPAMDPDAVVAALGLPLFVKPAHEGSSLGMSRVDHAGGLAAAYAKAAAFDARVMAEAFIAGPEYTASIVDRRVLPLIHIETPRRFYDYEAKYAASDTQYHCPCELPAEQEKTLARLALRAFDAVGARGWGRVDFMLDDAGAPWFLELNTTPGMTAHSLVPVAARAAGMDFDALVWRILAATVTAEAHDELV